MGFGDLKTEAGLQSLNCYLSDKSYIEGYVPSQGDVAVFNAVRSAPNAKFVNALRWFNQISSYNEDNKLAFPGIQKPIEQYGAESSAGAATGGGDDDDDDFDPFASGDETRQKHDMTATEESIPLVTSEQRLPDNNLQRDKVVIAKSNIVLDVKPWDDETDMADIEAHVRSIQADGLIWRASKLVDLAYGIKKLQISCIVEDDKVGMDFLEEKITENEDLVQSVDIAAFNKV